MEEERSQQKGWVASAVLAWLGLEATALAWPEVA